jgi:autotransporter-associated beta strand protein
MKSAKPFLRVLPKHLTCFSAICLAFLSAVSARAQTPWLNQDYSVYTVGDFVATTNTPALLTSAGSNNVIVDVGGNKKVQYNKIASASGIGTIYKLSDNLSTDRPQGYFSFKATIGTNVTGSSYLSYVLGANDSNSMSAAASTYLQIRLYNTNPLANQLRIYSGSGNTNNPAQVFPASGYSTLPTNENTFQVWYNKTATPMSYTNPSGVSNQLNTNSFVVYINGSLYGSNASSTGPLPASVLSVSGSVTNTATSIGKLGWWAGSSSQPYNVTFDNVYASDSAPAASAAPTITSSSNGVPLLNVPYTYQIVTDPIGATSYALNSGTLPAGLSLNTTNGLISGTATTLGGPTTAVLTASNSVGTGPLFSLSLTVIVPLNVFSGSNPSLNTAASWSLGAPPTPTTSVGSFKDVSLASSATDLTTLAAALSVQSWNVTNGSNYTLTSLKPDGSTTFYMGRSSTNAGTSFTNSVSGVADDLVYLTSNSILTFSPLNSSATPTNSTVQIAYGGNLNISAGSILNIDAVLTGTSATYGINKTGSGTLNLSAANTFGGSAAGTTLSAGTLNVKGSAAPTRLAEVLATISGGAVTGFTIVDGGDGYTVAPAISISKSSGDSTGAGATATATISGGAVTAVNVTTGGTGYTLSPKVFVYSTQSPLGVGINSLSGGTLNATVDTDISRMSTYADSNNTFFRINGYEAAFNGPVTLNVDADKTLSCYTLAGNTNSANLITKNGDGTLRLRGGGSSGFIGGFQVNAGTLYINVSANSGTGTNGTITMNGGNLLLSKGVGSAGIYSALDISNTISVLADTTITLDPNTNTATENNLSSAPLLQSSATKTITVAKTANANAGAQMLFKSAELGGTTTFNVADATQVALCGAIGTGAVTKTGLGTLVLSVLSPTTISNNTYTGTTAINAGTVVFGDASVQASSIAIASGAAANFTLGAATPTTTGSLTFSNGSTVRVSGTPTTNSAPYTLVSASGGITGTPTLDPAVPGYSLSNSGTSLFLVANSSPVSFYSAWLTNYPTLSNTNGTADPDGDGFDNNMEFAFDGNPTVGTASLLTVTSRGSNAVFNFLASTNPAAVFYTVQATTNLSTSPWADDIGVTASVTNSANQTNPPILLAPEYVRREFSLPATNKSFYRVKATIAP